MSRRERHVVWGAGQVGPQLAHQLLTEGHEVRLCSRRPHPGWAHPNLSICAGDATERRFVDEVCRGATAIYNCTNPPYHRWNTLLEPLFDSIRLGAARAGARLVVLDNLYMYGMPPESPFDEDTLPVPQSRKGELRKRLFDRRYEAHARGEVQTTSGHASDFFGPGAGAGSLFGTRFFQRLHRGQAVEVLGNPDQPHGYTFIPDVARALAVLGTHPEALGRHWHLPTTWRGTTRELVDDLAREAGQTARMTQMSRTLLRVLGLFLPPARGLPEMIYQWEQPFVLDDGRFCETFDIRPTQAPAAVAAAVAAHPTPWRSPSAKTSRVR